MTSPRRIVDLVLRCCLTPAVQALMSLGGIDVHVAVRGEQWVPFEGSPDLVRLTESARPVPIGPSGGHPERLRPDIPLTGAELALLAELDPSGRLLRRSLTSEGSN